MGGTEIFSAPECLTGEAPVTTKADIWSVGAVLYYMTYGDPPVDLISHPPPLVSRTRSNLVHDVIHRCLQRNPAKRASHRWLTQHPFTASPAIV